MKQINMKQINNEQINNERINIQYSLTNSLSPLRPFTPSPASIQSQQYMYNTAAMHMNNNNNNHHQIFNNANDYSPNNLCGNPNTNTTMCDIVCVWINGN